MLFGHSGRRRFCRQQDQWTIGGISLYRERQCSCRACRWPSGCDLQFARNWVIGAQIDGAWTNLTGSEALAGSQGLPPSGNLNLSGNLNFKANVIATATGRIGYAVNYDSI